MTLADELARFPMTGRFMASRLRHAMSDAEKAILEDLGADVRETQGETCIVARGPCSSYQPIGRTSSFSQP